MRQEGHLRNNLKQIRTRKGMSQNDLAALARISRQTVSGVESDLYAPSAAVALRIARALGCRVEDLFWLEDEGSDIEATPAEGTPAGDGLRVALARVGGKWVAHPLAGDRAFRQEMVPADGHGSLARGRPTMRVKLLDDAESVVQTVILAGCSPALSLWAQAAERWHPGLRVHWTFANSMEALGSLQRGEVHAAGVHLYDAETGDYNVPFVRQALPGRAVVLVNLGIWEEGLLVKPGNPLGLQSAADLAQAGVRLVNREEGAGSRQLLERTLAQAGVPCGAILGFDQVVGGHTQVAREVASGRADVGVSTASMAAMYGLGFVPLQEVRYDMAIPREYLDEPPVRQLVTTLGHRRVRSQLEALGGYNTSLTGDVVATV